MTGGASVAASTAGADGERTPSDTRAEQPAQRTTEQSRARGQLSDLPGTLFCFNYNIIKHCLVSSIVNGGDGLLFGI